MNERDTYTTGGHLTVARSTCEHSMLLEVWELEHLVWADAVNGDDDDFQYDVVKCHVAHVNDIPNHGVPYSDERVTDTFSWGEVPEEIREAFLDQIEEINTAVDALTGEVDDE